MGRRLLVLSALLPAFTVLTVSSSFIEHSSPVTVWVRDAIAVADFFEPTDKAVAQADIMAAAEETMANKDVVLLLVWQQLFRIGSLLFDDYAARQKLEEVDIQKHVDFLNSGEFDPFAETELSTAVRECSTSELKLEQQAARTEEVFKDAMRAASILHPGHMDVIAAKYAPLGRFLHQLRTYFEKRRGRVSLVHRKKVLQKFAAQGDLAAQNLIVALNLKSDKFSSELDEHRHALENTAHECYESGLLFKGVVSFMRGAAPIARRSSAACHGYVWVAGLLQNLPLYELYTGHAYLVCPMRQGAVMQMVSAFVLTIGTSRSGIFLERHPGLTFLMMMNASSGKAWDVCTIFGVFAS